MDTETIILGLILLILFIPYIPIIISKLSKKTERRLHYRKKTQVLRWKIWDAEFIRVQHKSMREGIRMEYDRLQEIIDACRTRIKNENESGKPNKDVIANMDKTIKDREPNVTQFKNQMDAIDQEIEKTTQAIDGYRVVINLLKEEIKKK